MGRLLSPIDQVNLIGKLADLKDRHYRNTLVIEALTELFIEKGWLTREELEQKITELDLASLPPQYPIPSDGRDTYP